MLILGSKNSLNVPHSWPCSSRNAINVESLSLTSRKKKYGKRNKPPNHGAKTLTNNVPNNSWTWNVGGSSSFEDIQGGRFHSSRSHSNCYLYCSTLTINTFWLLVKLNEPILKWAWSRCRTFYPPFVTNPTTADQHTKHELLVKCVG